MGEGREVVSVVVAWLFQLAFVGLIVFAVYRINGVHRQLAELQEDVKALRDRVDGMPPVQ